MIISLNGIAVALTLARACWNRRCTPSGNDRSHLDRPILFARERITLDAFLGGMMGGFNGLYYRAAAVFQAIPAWLRFLESRRLIDADVRQKVAKELLPLHATLSKIWQSYQDDPALDHQGRAWPADVANGPSKSRL